MKIFILMPLALLGAAPALAQEGPPEKIVIAEANSSMLVKMTTSMSTTTSKVGDRVAGMLIDPRQLRGAQIEGAVERSDHNILSFAFDTIRIDGKAYPIQSRLVSVTSSKGNEGRDDLDQRIRIEGVGIIAFGVHSALDEGAEVRITAWKK
ncbi:MAG: hypothetical protein V4530_05660 [Pseudomonadota bacterium]